MRAMPRMQVSRMPPTAAISSATVSEAASACIHKNEIGTVAVFCAKKMIKATATTPATQIAVQAVAARVRGRLLPGADSVDSGAVSAAAPVGAAGSFAVAAGTT